MSRRRIAENIMVAVITAIQVLACRLGFGRRSFALGDARAEAAPILVVRCEAKIGDNLLHIPFLRALRALYPGRQIHLVHHENARAIYDHCPFIDKRIEIAWPMSAPATLLRRLSLCADVFKGAASGTRYGLAMAPRWDEDLYAPFIAWMSGAPRVIGFSRRVLPEKAWRNFGIDWLLTDAVLDATVQHESRRSLQLLVCLANAHVAPSADLEFWFSEEDQKEVTLLQNAAAPSGVTWVAIAPGAAIDRRKWHVANFASVAQALGQRPGVRLMLLGTAAEAVDCETLLQASRPGASLNLAGRLSLAQTAAALQACRLFIGNDSGLLHLASAVRTPVIEISCHPMQASELHANSPARFGPTAPISAVLRPARPLTQACRHGCIFGTAHCITAVTAASVVHTAESLLDAELSDLSAENLSLPKLTVEEDVRT